MKKLNMSCLRNLCQRTRPGLTKEGKKVDQSVCGTRSTFVLSAEQAVSARRDEARGQIELSEARGLGHRAIIVRRVFPQSSHITPIQPLRASQSGYLGPHSGHGSKGRWIKLDVATQGETKGGSGIKGE